MPHVCLSLNAGTLKRDLSLVNKYKNFISILELRADFLSEKELLSAGSFPKMTNFPVILCIRREQDGGRFIGSEGYRIELLKKIIIAAGKNKQQFKYIDLEEYFDSSEIERIAKENNITIIRSFHDFDSTPPDLGERIKKLARTAQEIPKAAVMPKNIDDCMRIYKAGLENSGRKKIIIGMGEYGFHTRVLSDLFGSYLTYTSSGVNKAAPGHVNPKILCKKFLFHSINQNTKIFGIIGNPVMHTKSPAIHNKGYEKLKLNAVYVPFTVDEVKAFMNYAELLQVQGFSITVPYKQEIIKHLSFIDDSVKKIGSCNTAFKKEGSFHGTNTDAYGFIFPLKKLLKLKRIKKAAVIGAGGAARAVVYALKQQGLDILILNRTKEKAKNLAFEFSCSYDGLDAKGILKISDFSDLIVQTTKCGMHPDEDEDPIEGYKFSGQEIVYDLIYNPNKTKILKRAEGSGCRIINGMSMLKNQAYMQFKYFTGFDYP